MTNYRIEVSVDPTQAVDGTKKVVRELDGLEAKAASVQNALAKAFLLIGGAAVIKEILGMADAWTDLTSRVRIAVGSQDLASETMTRLADIARRTYSDLNLTAESFLLNSTALRELGYNTQQQLDYTEALNNALVVSGAKGDRARQVTEALAKAMAFGTLQGENLNTVVQTGGRVAEALATGLGVTTNELRKLGAEGKITTVAAVEALTSQMEVLRGEAESMPATIGDAFTILKNNLLQYIGKADEATGISSTLSQTILFLSGYVEELALGVGVLALALGAQFLANMAASIAVTGSLTARVIALNAALLANPLIGFTIATAALTAATVAWGVAMIGAEEEVSKLQAAGNKLALTDFGKLGDDILSVKKNLEAALRAQIASNGTNAIAAAKVEEYRAKLQKLNDQQQLLRTGQAASAAQAAQLQKATDALAKSAADYIGELEKENNLLTFNSHERAIQAELLKEIATLNKGEGPKVTDAQKAALEAAIRNNQALRDQDAVLQKIRGPQEQFATDLGSLQALLTAGRISTDEFNKGLLAIATSTEGIDLKALGVSGGGADTGALSSIQAQIAAQKELATAETNRVRVLQDINGPAQELIDKQEILKTLLSDCSITQEQYNTASKDTFEALNLLNPAYAAQQALLEEIVGPMRQAQERQTALDGLFAQGAITAAQYEAEVVKLDAALHPLTDSQQRQADLIKELVGPTEELKQRQADLNALYLAGSLAAGVYAEETKRIQEALHPLSDAQKLQADILAHIHEPQDQLIATQTALNALYASGAITAQEYATALDQATVSANSLGSDASQGLAAGLAQIRLHLNDVGGAVEQTLVNGFKAGEDALVNFVRTGKADFSGFVNSILDDLARLAVQQLLAGLFPSPNPSGGGGGGAGSLAGFFGSLFGGGKAEGGSVTGGKAYLVGEKGPEIFHTPQGGGNIVPAGETAAALRSSAPAPVVNVTTPPVQIVNVSDPSEIPRAIQSQAGEEAIMNVISRKRQTVKGLTK